MAAPEFRTTERVVFERCRNGLAVITLNRPRALNAMDGEMCRSLRAHLASSEADSSIKAVLLRGSAGSFCAGGDVRSIMSGARTGAAGSAREHMRQQFSLQFEMREMATPVVALMEGVAMGFGLGLAASSHLRVTTEDVRVAMPETRLGLFPDNAFAFTAVESMAPGVGRLMGLSGCHVAGAGDVLAAGLATHHVPKTRLPSLVEALKAIQFGGDARVALCGCLRDHVAAVGSPELLCSTGPAAALLRSLRVAESLEQAQLAFQQALGPGSCGHDSAAAIAAAFFRGAPFSRAVAWELLRAAERDAAAGHSARLRLGVAFERDFAAFCRMIERSDLLEGVRTTLVDKGATPKWDPATLDDVPAGAAAAALALSARPEERIGLQVPAGTPAESRL